MSKSTWVKIGIAVLLLLAIVSLAVGLYWSREPDAFDVRAQAAKEAQTHQQKVVIGTTTTATLIHLVEVMLDKPGGYFSNDVSPPAVWLDNMPNWEYGVLLQVRDLTRSMRNDISRSRSQSVEPVDLAKAEAHFNISPTTWVMPNAQSEYRDGITNLRSYLQHLANHQQENAQFYARSDNLKAYLLVVEKRLGSLALRLSASVEQRRINTDLGGDSAATQSTRGKSELLVKTPWLQVDDIFYEARGSTWALVQILRAMQVDFADVLNKSNANVSLEQIIRELEAAQAPIYSPMVLNGAGFGLVANHSLEMAGYLSRANAALIDLRTLLEGG